MKNTNFLLLCFLALSFSSCATNTGDYTLRELNLSQKKLNDLPADLSSYAHLERLYADANNITNIPNETVANLYLLQELDLSYNKLYSLPEKMSQAKNLEKVDLSFNQFSEFPKVLLDLQNLRTLDIRSNNIKDLPEDIKNLKKLEIIYLAGNNMDASKRAEYRSWLPRTKFIWAETKTE